MWRWCVALLGLWWLQRVGLQRGRVQVWLLLAACVVGAEATTIEGGVFVWNTMGLAVSANAGKLFFSEKAREKLAALITHLRDRKPAAGALLANPGKCT